MKKIFNNRKVVILLAIAVLLNLFSMNVFAMSDAEVAEILVGLSVEEQFEWLEEHPEVDWNLEMGEIVENPNVNSRAADRTYYRKRALATGVEQGVTWLSYRVEYNWSVQTSNPNATIAIESIRIYDVVKNCPSAIRYDGPVIDTYGADTNVGYASSVIIGGVLCPGGYYELAQYGTLLPQGTTNIRNNWYKAA